MTSSEIKLPFLEGLKTPPKHSKEDVEHIRQWLTHMPHLPQMPDENIHLFLHCNYSQLERTKKTIENFFTIRTHAPELFSKRDIFEPALQRMLTNVESARAAGRTSEGYTVWISRLKETDPSKFELMPMLKLFFMLGETFVSEDGLSPGYVTVFDMKGVALGHLASVSLSAVKTCMQYVQEAAPVRIKHIHVINAVPFMDRILSLIKPFMKPELHELLHIHTSSDVLTQLFPLEALPSDYGGKGESMAALQGEYRQLMETKYCQFLQKASTYLVDESKRPGKTSGGKQFGAEGSFRTLSID